MLPCHFYVRVPPPQALIASYKHVLVDYTQALSNSAKSETRQLARIFPTAQDLAIREKPSSHYRTRFHAKGNYDIAPHPWVGGEQVKDGH